MVLPMVDWKRPTFASRFHLKFKLHHPKSKIIEITMMITRCGEMVNDKRLPTATTPIEMLFIIV
jgi:hypothetical protein